MSEKEPKYIICLRQDDAKWATITEGSTTANCIECDKPVWISPASVDLMLERDTKPLCIYCAAGKADDEMSINPPSVEQLKEVIRELKKETQK